MFKFFANRPTIFFNLGIALNLVIMAPVFWFIGGRVSDIILNDGNIGLFLLVMPPVYVAGLVIFGVQLFYWNRWFEARVWHWRGRVLGDRRA